MGTCLLPGPVLQPGRENVEEQGPGDRRELPGGRDAKIGPAQAADADAVPEAPYILVKEDVVIGSIGLYGSKTKDTVLEDCKIIHFKLDEDCIAAAKANSISYAFNGIDLLAPLREEKLKGKFNEKVERPWAQRTADVGIDDIEMPGQDHRFPGRTSRLEKGQDRPPVQRVLLQPHKAQSTRVLPEIGNAGEPVVQELGAPVLSPVGPRDAGDGHETQHQIINTLPPRGEPRAQVVKGQHSPTPPRKNGRSDEGPRLQVNLRYKRIHAPCIPWPPGLRILYHSPSVGRAIPRQSDGWIFPWK